MSFGQGRILNYVKRAPLGVVVQIAPFNHPLLIGEQSSAVIPRILKLTPFFQLSRKLLLPWQRVTRSLSSHQSRWFFIAHLVSLSH